MEISQSPEKLREYATRFRYYVDEYKYIENSVKHLTNDVLYNLDICNINRQIDQVREYIEVLQGMCIVMERTAQELERTANCYFELSPPLFDFISIIDIKEWWKQAYPIIEQIATVTGAITGVATITATPLAFIKWIRNKLQQKQEKNEYKWIRFILQENEWNISILSQKLELSENETKKILRGFGYIWDAKKMLYIATENTYKLKNIKI